MKQLRTFSLIFLGILLMSFRSIGQDTITCNDQIFQDPFLEKIIGRWNVNGQVGGDKVVYHFVASWELNHQFVCLTFADTSKKPAYSAKVFIGYDCVSERYVAHWLDNFGGRFSETLGFGIRKGQSIEFRFEYPDGPFLNTFSYNPVNDSWLFHTTIKNRKGIWVTFGDIFLKRKQ